MISLPFRCFFAEVVKVVPFYGECLKSLAKVPPSADTLSKLSSFLVSTFNRIPKPALGPSLFKAFWIKTYQHYPSTVLYPEPLKSILRSIQEIMCEPEEVLAPGISQATGTPSQEWVRNVLYTNRKGDNADITPGDWQWSVPGRR